jgi:hypothetical protein
MHQYPDAVNLGNVEHLSQEMLHKAASRATEFKIVLHCTGPPCQNVSGLNATRAGVGGQKSKLVNQVGRVDAMLRQAFPHAKHHRLGEMVASLTAEDQATYDKIFGGVPLKICAGDLSYARRPRLYWITWRMTRDPCYEIKEQERWTTLKLKPRRKMGLSSWLPKGFRTVVEAPMFPTFVRAVKKKKPPFKPAGIDSCNAETLERYQAFDFIYPPYQFKLGYMLRDPKGKLVPPPAVVREVLMGFPKHYTFAALNSKARKVDPQGYEYARCSLIGNSFNASVVAFLLGHGLFDMGMLHRPPTAEEVAVPSKPCNLSLDTASTFDEQKWQADRDQDSPEALVRYYLARPTIRGGEVTAYNAVAPSKAQLLRSVEADEWIWNTTIATGWKSLGEHINVLEARALLLAIRWRARSPWFHHQRFLHLIDSRVVLSTVSKGRSSSYNLRRVLSKINAYCLAAHLWPKLAYVASELNPADTPSRAKREVKKHKFKNSGTRRLSQPAGKALQTKNAIAAAQRRAAR